MKCTLRTIGFFVCCLLFLFCLAACAGDDGDSADSTDDDAADDDNAADDDLVDDDAVDDDDNDNDDDDDNDDDNNDDNDNDSADDDETGSYIERIDGGSFNPADVAIAHADGTDYMAVVEGRQLTIYSVAANGDIDHEILADNSGRPRLAIDSQGALHVLHFDTLAFELIYQTNRSGEWVAETVAANLGQAALFLQYDLALTADGRPRVALAAIFPYFATRNAAGWAIEQVGDFLVSAVALRIAANDTAHLACTGRNGLDVQVSHVVQTAKGWQRNVAASHLADVWSGDFGTSYVFTNPAIALDSQGSPRLTYQLTSQMFIWMQTGVYHSIRGEEDWMTESIAGADGAIGYSSLEIDAQDRSHVIAGPIGPAKHVAYWTSDSDDINIAQGVTGAPGLTLDGDGKPHVGVASPTFLYRAVLNNAAWTWTQAAAAAQTTAPVMTRAADGSLHVAYYHATDGALKYAVKQHDEWTFEDIFALPIAPLDVAIATGADNNPHVCLVVGPEENRHLLYGHRLNGIWEVEEVATGELGIACDLVVDGEQTPHLAYAWSTHPNTGYPLLAHAVKEGETWIEETVSVNKYHERKIILRLAPDGTLALAGANSSAQLTYFERIDGDWNITTFYNATNGIDHFDLQFLSNSQPRLVYSHYESQLLVLAARVDGTWKHSLIAKDFNYLSFGELAMAIGPDDAIHLGYAFRGSGSSVGDDLRYLHQKGSNWQTTTVHSAGDIGQYPSIAVSAGNRIHLVYAGEDIVWHASFPAP